MLNYNKLDVQNYTRFSYFYKSCSQISFQHNTDLYFDSIFFNPSFSQIVPI